MAIYKGNQKIDGGYPIATEISSSSTNSEVAGAKAVYDNSLDVYSTTERRVGTWIDGKPLYQSIISVISFPNSQEITFNHNIANIDNICALSGIARNLEGLTKAVPYITSSQYSYIWLFANKTQIGIGSTGNISSYSGEIFLSYTKTTD